MTQPDSTQADKLDRVTPLAMSIVGGEPCDFADAHQKMTQEVVESWEAKWNK